MGSRARAATTRAGARNYLGALGSRLGTGRFDDELDIDTPLQGAAVASRYDSAARLSMGTRLTWALPFRWRSNWLDLPLALQLDSSDRTGKLLSRCTPVRKPSPSKDDTRGIVEGGAAPTISRAPVNRGNALARSYAPSMSVIRSRNNALWGRRVGGQRLLEFRARGHELLSGDVVCELLEAPCTPTGRRHIKQVVPPGRRVIIDDIPVRGHVEFEERPVVRLRNSCKVSLPCRTDLTGSGRRCWRWSDFGGRKRGNCRWWR